MSRRTFLKSVGLLGGAGLAGRETPQATAAGLDLNDIDVIDVHVHPPQPMRLRQSYDGWNSSFVDALLPAYDYPQKEELREKLGRNDLCPCGSGRRFQALLSGHGTV